MGYKVGSYTRYISIDGKNTSPSGSASWGPISIRGRSTLTSNTFSVENSMSGYYQFTGWTVTPDYWGVSGSSNESLVITYEQTDEPVAITVTANFTERGITNIVTPSPEEGGTGNAQPGLIQFGISSSSVSVTIEAVPNPGYAVKSITTNTGLSISTTEINGEEGVSHSTTVSVQKSCLTNSGSTLSGYNLHHSVAFTKKTVTVNATSSPGKSCFINSVYEYTATFSLSTPYTLRLISASGYAIKKITSTLGDNITLAKPTRTHTIDAVAAADITWTVECEEAVTITTSVNMEECGTVALNPTRSNDLYFVGESVTATFNPSGDVTFLAFVDWSKWENGFKNILSKENPITINVSKDSDRVNEDELEIRAEASPADGAILCNANGTILAASSSSRILSRSPPSS